MFSNLVEKKISNQIKRFITDFNNTTTNYPKQKALQQLFEEQAKRDPNAQALVFEENQLTYQELNAKANQVAHFLNNQGIGRGKIVGLMVERSLDMIVGMMGILKAGAAYLPIDPAAPTDRIEYMLEDSKAELLLTEEKYQGIGSIENVCLDRYDFGLEETANLPSVNDSSDPAYIIYTSGSTGKPKGVVIRHYSAVRVVRETNYIDIQKEDVILQLSNYSFDGSIFDIYGALLNGAKLVLIDKDTVVDMDRLGKVIKQQKVSILFITTALFNTIVDLRMDCLNGVRKILFGGERVSVPHVRKALDYLGPYKIIHMYGPTESTVYATYYPVNEIDEDANTLPIGRPLANTRAYIVDEDENLVPVGVPGELCLSGDGLSQGYLNNPTLTKEKFVPNPFETEGSMYRTGDLARWLPDGNIEFIGRIDHQVKIRGYRIELGEIESQLIKQEAVKETIVTVREDNQQSAICAYYTSDEAITTEDLYDFLEKRLPEYMIPTYFVPLEKLPLTKNGKVDRAALPKPDKSINERFHYKKPTNFVEEKLELIWKDVLGVEKLGINVSFFEVGGNSLKAMEIVNIMNRSFNVDISIKQFFEGPSIKELASIIISSLNSIEADSKYVEEEI